MNTILFRYLVSEDLGFLHDFHRDQHLRAQVDVF